MKTALIVLVSLILSYKSSFHSRNVSRKIAKFAINRRFTTGVSRGNAKPPPPVGPRE